MLVDSRAYTRIMERLVVVNVGGPGSGKTETTNHLVQNRNFARTGPSMLIREYASERGIALNNERTKYRDTFAQMAREQTLDGIVDRMLEVSDGNLVIDGERIPEQLLRIRERERGALVVAHWCDINVRYDRRAKQLSEAGQPVPTFDQFVEVEREEWQNPAPPHIATIDVLQMADVHLFTTQQPLEVVHAQLDAAIDSRFAQAA
jgi:cytidylate kinase